MVQKLKGQSFLISAIAYLICTCSENKVLYLYLYLYLYLNLKAEYLIHLCKELHGTLERVNEMHE